MCKYVIFAVFFANISLASASDIQSVRTTVGETLNSAVSEIRGLLSDSEASLGSTETNAANNQKNLEELESKVGGDEVNPTVLNHARKSIPKCDYKTKNLVWDGSSWKCVRMTAQTECQAPAPDEYMYKNSSGHNVCAKSPKGSAINYYYQFRTYSNKCLGASQGYEKLYDCKYTNKLGKKIEVSSSYCSKKSKPSVAKKACKKDWTVGSWGSCSKTCGGGVKIRKVFCESGYDCSSYKQPHTSEKCNTQLCKANWITTSWGSCSAKGCGTTGKRYRKVYCPENKSCSHQKMPHASENCSAPSCSYGWRWGSWSACNKSCGGGTQTRNVRCANVYYSSKPTVADSYCKTKKPAVSQSCNTQKCITYNWYTSGFGKCNKSCGGGKQYQTVYCKGSNGAKVSDWYCRAKPKPGTSKSCNTQKCITYKWYASGFGGCNKSCGGGKQYQTVYCKSSTGSKVSDGYCKGQSRPATSKSCNTQACITYNWYASGFGKCNKSCGGGKQYQTVYCKGSNGAKVSDWYCRAKPKPGTSKSCNTQVCVTYKWVATNYGKCSKSCNTGTQTRSVYCKASTGSRVSDGYCNRNTRPPSSQKCNTQACMCLRKTYSPPLLTCKSKSQKIRTPSQAGCGVPWIIQDCSRIIVNGKVCVRHSSGGQNNGGGVFGHSKPIFNCASGFTREGNDCVKKYYVKC